MNICSKCDNFNITPFICFFLLQKLLENQICHGSLMDTKQSSSTKKEVKKDKISWEVNTPQSLHKMTVILWDILWVELIFYGTFWQSLHDLL